jgi:hypothetical protein
VNITPPHPTTDSFQNISQPPQPSSPLHIPTEAQDLASRYLLPLVSRSLELHTVYRTLVLTRLIAFFTTLRRPTLPHLPHSDAMSGSDENGSPGPQEKPEGSGQNEHLNIKVTDNNNEVFFKIKRTTQLKKLMDAFCERQGKAPASVRFLFDGSRVQPTDSPDTVSISLPLLLPISRSLSHSRYI